MKASFKGKTMLTGRARKLTDIRLDGGELCLDFTNTIHDRSVTPPEDYLGGFEDLLNWLALTNSLPQNVLSAMKRAASSNPQRARHAFKGAIAFRELLYRVFSSVARGSSIPQKDLLALGTKFGETLSNLRLLQEGKRVIPSWTYGKGNLEQALWPIAKSAMNLLLSDDADHIKECPRCFWLFHDTTKNGRRRWCSMQTCGSIDKALRYYYRQKSEAGPSPQ